MSLTQNYETYPKTLITGKYTQMNLNDYLRLTWI